MGKGERTKTAIPEAGERMDETRRHGYWEEAKVYRFRHPPARLPSSHPEGRGRILVAKRQEVNSGGRLHARLRVE